MVLLKRFAFWLPLLTIIHYIYELTINPVKDIVFAFDPILSFLFNMLSNVTYDVEQNKILIPGFLIHFFLWLIYGLIIDSFIRKIV